MALIDSSVQLLVFAIGAVSAVGLVMLLMDGLADLAIRTVDGPDDD